MPEVLWKMNIDFEIEQEAFERTRKLYRRLLERKHHVKVSQHLTSAQMVLNLLISNCLTVCLDSSRLY